MYQEARKQYLYFLLPGLFFIVDRVCKYIAPSTTSAGWPLLGWEYFENMGIAFSLPVPSGITIISTPIILIALLILATRQGSLWGWYAWTWVCLGAISNVIDRILYGYVIDYVRVGTGVLNIADIMIIGGILLFVQTQRAP